MADKRFGSLGARLRRRAEEMNKTVEQAVKEGALAGMRAATSSTPVDTGNARSNWNASVKEASLEVETVQGLSEAQAGQKALKKALPKINSFKIEDGQIWLTNAVKYIRRLDTGGISKKGGNMSAKATLAANRAIKRRLARGIFKKG